MKSSSCFCSRLSNWSGITFSQRQIFSFGKLLASRSAHQIGQIIAQDNVGRADPDAAGLAPLQFLGGCAEVEKKG